MHPSNLKLATLAVVALCSTPTMAANLFVNSSFEDLSGVTFGGQSFCYLHMAGNECTAIPGWASTNTPTLIQSTSSPWNLPASISGWSATQGSIVLGLQSDAEIHQSVNLSAGDYLLTWRESHRARADLSAAQSYAVTANGAVLGTFTSSLGDAWLTRSLTFTSQGGSTTLMFDGLVVGSDTTVFLDSMSLTAVSAVDEPGTAAFAACGLLTLLLVSARRRIPAA